ncbi:MAG TPA: MarR family transcriptional regulator [Phycicoccus elongatus]|uniref:MarR family winged helix-turn-helix transcriptional regulator n=1 Tax=Phycicoccus TaxID=367298 RepID=UPI002BA7E240|nr:MULTISPECIES: MarR family transcriptional regulator [Phycicoccus]HPK13757.1 MarR family transcriptional regulator [Phycicoccus elongatus]HRV57921.1 MarR family transcriptional regulator [Phycicoccus sp.]
MVATSQRRELGILLFVANRSLEERAFDAVIAAGITDITSAQAKVAARIGPDGTRVSDIAAQARVTKQSAAFLVEQLETAGYVERVPDPTDGRARLVRLTPRALPLIEAANAEVERVLAEWSEHLGADRLDQLHGILLDLREITDPWR